MKILLLSHKFYPDIGGIETNSEVLATEFEKAGHEVQIVTWTSEKGEKSFNFPILRNPDFFQLIRIYSWADVVFENNPSLRLSWPLFFIRKPHVVALNTMIERSSGKHAPQDKLKYRWLKRSTAVIAVSDAVRKKTFSDAIVIGNPFREQFREIPEVERNIPFVFLGRLVSDKGVDIAIKAVEILYRRGELNTFGDILLTIIGKGSEEEALKNLAAEKGLANKVVFKGRLEGEELVVELNRHLHLLVPSVWEEPFGNVALEGMACGCLPFVSHGGGLPDAVGKAGVVFESGNAMALANAISHILSHPQEEIKLRNAAEKHLLKHKAEAVAIKYLEVVEAAVESHTKKAGRKAKAEI